MQGRWSLSHAGNPFAKSIDSTEDDNDMSESPELSVVMPCLNEADTVGICVEKAVRAMREHGIQGEIVLADNGSSDNSKEIKKAIK